MFLNSLHILLPLQIPLALLNARMSLKSFERWSTPPMQALVAAMLARFSLIAPLVVFFPAIYHINIVQVQLCHFEVAALKDPMH